MLISSILYYEDFVLIDEKQIKSIIHCTNFTEFKYLYKKIIY